jgi:hypothetical protein
VRTKKRTAFFRKNPDPEQAVFAGRKILGASFPGRPPLFKDGVFKFPAEISPGHDIKK